MKKIVFLLFPLLLCFYVQSQEQHYYTFNKEEYRQKATGQKTMAIALACGGTAFMLMRKDLASMNLLSTGLSYKAYAAIGLGCVAASIHYFILSANNRRTATTSVFLDLQKQPSPGNTSEHVMTAIGVSLAIRR